jgi:hypothetical protein
MRRGWGARHLLCIAKVENAEKLAFFDKKYYTIAVLSINKSVECTIFSTFV